MTSRLSLAVVALLVTLTLAACGGSKPASDGKPGVEMSLHVEALAGSKVTPSETSRMEHILRNRLKALGAKGSVTAGPQPSDVVVRIDGATVGSRETRLLVDQAQLEFYDLYPALVPPSRGAGGGVVAAESLCGLLSHIQATATAGTPSAYYLVASPTRATGACRQLAGPLPNLHRDKASGDPGLLDPFSGSVPKSDEVLAVPAQTTVITCSAATATVCPDGTNGTTPPAGHALYYLFKHGAYPGDRYGPYPSMTGADLRLSGTQQDFDPTTGQPIVTMQFTSEGDKLFHRVTKNEAIRGASTGLGANCAAKCAFAIVLDNELRSWPAIDPTQDPQGIDPTGSGAEVTGIGSTQEARDFAFVLQTGALPAALVLLSERAVR